MEPGTKAHKEGVEKDIRKLEALKRLNGNPDAEPVFELLINTAVERMIGAFTSDKIKTMEDWYKEKGRVEADLFPLQEIRGAEAMRDALKARLNEYYGKPA